MVANGEMWAAPKSNDAVPMSYPGIGYPLKTPRRPVAIGKMRGSRYHLVALIENSCGNESLCSGNRHHPSSPFSITGKA